ncbi:Acetylornithine deacetylase or succinyl-diaminopimelate desuccinylase [Devosia sp. LC5]|uniref:M20/M25/M40 family metallo-hydrolase n=1 Tax=Devosia sp. LC5 TaxID=1502724 RepID=UPI0004E2A875|nr:M20/M25/M40 family metallo-hydrolase [Devosia sp. LC5]KFC64534.1 Acetylornithine deacetylase or succinyl-diaminopimelate desuccinylase [Devosia sp. LC5]
MAWPTQAAMERIDREREAVLAFLQSLIRLQPSGETAIQAALADRLAATGARVQSLQYEPAAVPLIDEFAAGANAASGTRASIVGTYRAATSGGRSVILFAHPDGEPIGDTATWQRPPFEGVINDGRLYGWGVADDLAGVSAAVSAMEMIKAAGIELAGDVIVASTPSKRHARGVAAVLHHGYAADAAIYLHPAESGVGMNEIKAFASGQLEFTVTVPGKKPDTTEPGHTAFAHAGVNALDKAVILIAALKALDAHRARRVHHPLLDAAIGRSSNILLSSLQYGQNRAFSRMPTELIFGGAISFPPFEKLADVQAEVAVALDAAIDADPFLRHNRPVLHWVSGVTGMEVPESHDLYRAVAHSVEQVCGFKPHVNPMHTSSDIRNPVVQRGIPTVGLGPYCGDLTQTGRHDEWVDVEDYIRAVKVTAASVIAWCGTC